MTLIQSMLIGVGGVCWAVVGPVGAIVFLLWAIEGSRLIALVSIPWLGVWIGVTVWAFDKMLDVKP